MTLGSSEKADHKLICYEVAPGLDTKICTPLPMTTEQSAQLAGRSWLSSFCPHCSGCPEESVQKLDHNSKTHRLFDLIFRGQWHEIFIRTDSKFQINSIFFPWVRISWTFSLHFWRHIVHVGRACVGLAGENYDVIEVPTWIDQCASTKG